MKTPAGGKTGGRHSSQAEDSAYLLQVAHAAQSQQVHFAHPQALPVQQPQHSALAAAFTGAVKGAELSARMAAAINSSDFIKVSFSWKIE